MFLDFAMAAILIIFIIRGDRRGLRRSLIGLFGWAASAAVGLVMFSELDIFVRNKTDIAAGFTGKLTHLAELKIIDESGIADENVSPSSVLNMLQASSDSAFNEAADQVAQPIADAMLTLLEIIVIAFVIRFIYGIFVTLFRLIADDRGRRGAADSIGGIAVSIVESAIVMYVIMIVLLFVALAVSLPWLSQQLSQSFVVTGMQWLRLIPEDNNIMALLMFKG